MCMVTFMEVSKMLFRKEFANAPKGHPHFKNVWRSKLMFCETWLGCAKSMRILYPCNTGSCKNMLLFCAKMRRHLTWLALYLIPLLAFVIHPEPTAQTVLYFLL